MSERGRRATYDLLQDPGSDVRAALEWLAIEPVSARGLGLGSARYLVAQGWATTDGIAGRGGVLATRLTLTAAGRKAAAHYARRGGGR